MKRSIFTLCIGLLLTNCHAANSPYSINEGSSSEDISSTADVERRLAMGMPPGQHFWKESDYRFKEHKDLYLKRGLATFKPLGECSSKESIQIDPERLSEDFYFNAFLLPCDYEVDFSFGYFTVVEGKDEFIKVWKLSQPINVRKHHFYGDKMKLFYAYLELTPVGERIFTQDFLAKNRDRQSGKVNLTGALYLFRKGDPRELGILPDNYLNAANKIDNQAVFTIHDFLWGASSSGTRLMNFLKDEYEVNTKGWDNQQAYWGQAKNTTVSNIPWAQTASWIKEASIDAGDQGSLFLYLVGHANESCLPGYYDKNFDSVANIIVDARKSVGLGKLRELIVLFAGCYVGSGTQNQIRYGKKAAERILSIGSTRSGYGNQIIDGEIGLARHLDETWRQLAKKPSEASLGELYEKTNQKSYDRGGYGHLHGASFYPESFKEVRLFP